MTVPNMFVFKIYFCGWIRQENVGSNYLSLTLQMGSSDVKTFGQAKLDGQQKLVQKRPIVFASSLK